MEFIGYFPIFFHYVSFGLTLLLRDLKCVIADPDNLGNILNNKVVVEDSIHNIPLPFPFLTLTKSNAMAQRSLDILDDKFHFVMDVDVIGLEETFH